MAPPPVRCRGALEICALSRDPLATLEKLRRIEVEAARRRVADARDSLAEYRAAAIATEAMLRGEAVEAAPPTYGAFLARMLEARHATAAAEAGATQALARERDGLVAARAGEKVLTLLRERRAAEAGRRARRREQTRLEEASAPAR